ncbi:hypothetical protein Plhal304r1_c047g0128671 [Plasmopara halstedii]
MFDKVAIPNTAGNNSLTTTHAAHGAHEHPRPLNCTLTRSVDTTYNQSCNMNTAPHSHAYPK